MSDSRPAHVTIRHGRFTYRTPEEGVSVFAEFTVRDIRKLWSLMFEAETFTGNWENAEAIIAVQNWLADAVKTAEAETKPHQVNLAASERAFIEAERIWEAHQALFAKTPETPVLQAEVQQTKHRLRLCKTAANKAGRLHKHISRQQNVFNELAEKHGL